MKYFLRYFFRGLLFVAPASITIYSLYSIFMWVDTLFPHLPIPGLGLVIVLGGTTILGYLGSAWLTRPILQFFDTILEKLPFVRLIYSSIKDLTSAFVGEKKKFDKPVLVQLSQDSNLKRLGFLTQDDLTELGIGEESVAVYVPHSYNFSGNLYVVEKKFVTLLETDGADIMKFIVSGGVINLEE
ncbi:MAG: DUF502 domain-containing protein [Raineya sp.]|jgi:uncharacterized membrane protein|nr:DUF502 domain-containing protein [Raineya sp.]